MSLVLVTPSKINPRIVAFLLLRLYQPIRFATSLAMPIMTISSSTTETVRGVWQRLFEEDPLGDAANADRDTLVFWTQAPKSGIYVDLRLPKGSLGRQDRSTSKIPKHPAALNARGMASLVETLSDADRSILWRQKSFAGRLQFSLGDTTDSGEALAKDKVLAKLANEAAAAVSNSSNAASTNDSSGTSGAALPLCTCFWKRDIDYQPPSGGLDIGVCASSPPNADGSIDLRETGDDGSYAEGWRRLIGSESPPFFASQLLTEDGILRTGYWVRAGKYFAYAIGRPQDEATAQKLGCCPKSSQIRACVGKSLCEVVHEILEGKTHEDNVEDSLSMVGAYVCAFGEIITTTSSSAADGEGVIAWKIMHSTDPRLVGCDLLGSGPDSCTSMLSLEASGPSKQDNVLLQEGDVLCQTVVGLGGCTRRWQVIEVDTAAAMMNDFPRLSQEQH